MKADTSTSASEYCRHGIERWWARCDKCADEAVAALLEKTQALAQARRDVEAAEKACVDLCAFIGVNGLDFNGPDWMNAILRAKDVVKAVNAARARLAEVK